MKNVTKVFEVVSAYKEVKRLETLLNFETKTSGSISICQLQIFELSLKMKQAYKKINFVVCELN